jgi:hypothetical protein
MHWDHMGGWGWLFGSLMMLLWVAVLGLVVYIAVKTARRGPGQSS